MKTASRRHWCFTLVTVFVFLYSAPGAAQQQASIEGIVRTATRLPLASANATLKETKRGTVTSPSGRFAFENLPPGSYTLVVSLVGFTTIEHSIVLQPNDTLHLEFTMQEATIQLEPVVITGTRSEKSITNVPIPTTVITEMQMKRQSAVRLNDLLAEQPGMAINFNQFGTGVQVQGLDPSYTLVLIDGEPLIGRTAGTLELTRLSVGNLQRIEVVKGPSSSLYGSEALAAVINLVTRQPTEPLHLSLRSRYGSLNTLNVSTQGEVREGKFGISLFAERTSADGYDLAPETRPQTVGRSASYTVAPKLTYDLSEQTTLKLSGRYVTQNSTNIATVPVNGVNTDLDDRARLLDWSAASSLLYHTGSGATIEAKLYGAQYRAETNLSYEGNDGTFDATLFNQRYMKSEVQMNASIGATLVSTLGGGMVYETVEADRILGGKRGAKSYFAFAQQDWMPSDLLDFVGSVRYDAHSDYAARFTPKVAALVKPLSWLSVRASVGSGFKAPTFQQLYLDFTNAQVGYTVVGSAGIRDAFRKLQESGQVQTVFIQPATLEEVRPENSIAYNVGVEVHPWESVKLTAGVFRNDLKDLVEAAPIAMKTNGQAIYTYFNINKVFTRGLDTEFSVRLIDALTLAVSYEYLEAKDVEVLDDVRAGKIIKIGSTGRARPVEESEYAGLFNRSKHSGTIKAQYEQDAWGLAATLRGILRGRFGYADNNGNTILDDDSEYAPGYAVWSLTLSQQLTGIISVQAGVDNILDTVNKDFMPFLAGRLFYAGVAMSF